MNDAIWFLRVFLLLMLTVLPVNSEMVINFLVTAFVQIPASSL